MRVKEAMTPKLIGVPESASLFDALNLMVARKVSALIVFDAIGAPVGVLSEGDLMRRAELGAEKRRAGWLDALFGGGRSAREYARSHGRRVAEVMTRGVLSVDANAELSEAIDMMLEHKVRRLLVVDGSDSVGLISRSDLVRSDADIQAAIEAELEKQPWAPTASVRVLVDAGTVTLEGTIPDEALREGLKVLAENADGVKAVHDRLAWVEPNSGVYMNTPGED
jgi:CBS domain-containing protein